MIVCHCLGVTSSHLEAALINGALTVPDLMTATGAGTDCGACYEAITAVIEALQQPGHRHDHDHSLTHRLLSDAVQSH